MYSGRCIGGPYHEQYKAWREPAVYLEPAMVDNPDYYGTYHWVPEIKCWQWEKA